MLLPNYAFIYRVVIIVIIMKVTCAGRKSLEL